MRATACANKHPHAGGDHHSQ